MKNMLKAAAVLLALSTLTACTGSVQNKNKTCDYDYFCTQPFLFLKSLAAAVTLRCNYLYSV